MGVKLRFLGKYTLVGFLRDDFAVPAICRTTLPGSVPKFNLRLGLRPSVFLRPQFWRKGGRRFGMGMAGQGLG